MSEYGLFNDEGCIEADFYSFEAALLAKADYPDEEELVILKV